MASFQIMLQIRLIAMICSVYLCEADRKYWINTDARNLKDWNNRLSINGIHFPTSLQKPIAISTDKDDHCRIIFPMNNEEDEVKPDDDFDDEVKMFGLDGITRPKLDSSCANLDDVKTDEHFLWVDPRNWKSSMITEEVVPHIERLPCHHDQVVFNNTANLFVILPNKNLTVRQIQFGYKNMYAYNFNRSAQAESFLKHFVVSGNRDVLELLKINSTNCYDKVGCECGTKHLIKDTCALLESTCPKELPCPAPIKPFGHCCNTCGGYIKAYYDPETFVYNKFVRVVNQFFNSTGVKLSTYISKIEDDIVHVVIKGKSYFAVYNITDTLQRLLLSDKYTQLGIESAEVQPSKSLRNPIMPTEIARIIVVIFFISVFFFVAFFAFNSQTKKFISIFKRPFTYVKFENQSGKVQIGVNEKENSDSTKSDIGNEVKLQEEKENKLESETVHNLIDTTPNEL